MKHRKKRKTNGPFVFVILALMTVALGKVLWTSLTANSLTALAQISDSQPQNIQLITDLKTLESSLQDVFNQYQTLRNSSNQMSNDKIASALDKLYLVSANDYKSAQLLKVTPANAQTLNNLTQSADYLTASIYDLKDSLMNEGEFKAQLIKNSADDLALAIQNGLGKN